MATRICIILLTLAALVAGCGNQNPAGFVQPGEPAEKLVVTKQPVAGRPDWYYLMQGEAVADYDERTDSMFPVTTMVDREKEEFRVVVRTARRVRPGARLRLDVFTARSAQSTIIMHANAARDGRTITFVGPWREPISEDIADLMGFGANDSSHAVRIVVSVPYKTIESSGPPDYVAVPV